jgi:hypothetical protein
LELLERNSLSNSTKKRYHDWVETGLAEMTSISGSYFSFNPEGKTLQKIGVNLVIGAGITCMLPKRRSRTAASALQVEI